MDETRLLAEAQGYFTRADALAVGYDDRDLARSMRGGILVRVRRGAYSFSDLWAAADAVERHRVRSRAVQQSLGDAVALSHVSAAVHHGLDLWGQSLDRVHVTRLDGGAGRIEGDVVHHEGLTLDDDLDRVEGGAVVRPTRALIETAAGGTGEQALALFDAGIRHGLTSRERLLDMHRLMQHWPRMRHLHVPLRMADGRAESVGESRGSWLFWRHGIPAPIRQYEVRDSSGVLIGTCDWGWPEHGLLGEFDGEVKYGRLLRPGMTSGEVVFSEKQREDLMRDATGYRMIRIIWIDYSRPRVTADRVRSRLRVAT